MKNLLLLVVCTVFVLSVKGMRSEVVERIDVGRVQVVPFAGTMYLPRTLQVREENVKLPVFILSVKDKNYIYRKLAGSTYQLEQSQSSEVLVAKGDVIRVSDPTKLYFGREE